MPVLLVAQFLVEKLVCLVEKNHGGMFAQSLLAPEDQQMPADGVRHDFPGIISETQILERYPENPLLRIVKEFVDLVDQRRLAGNLKQAGKPSLIDEIDEFLDDP